MESKCYKVLKKFCSPLWQDYFDSGGLFLGLERQPQKMTLNSKWSKETQNIISLRKAKPVTHSEVKRKENIKSQGSNPIKVKTPWGFKGLQQVEFNNNAHNNCNHCEALVQIR